MCFVLALLCSLAVYETLLCIMSLLLIYYCNCNLITKLPWPGDSEGTFRSSIQSDTCPPVYHTRHRLHTIIVLEHNKGIRFDTHCVQTHLIGVPCEECLIGTS